MRNLGLEGKKIFVTGVDGFLGKHLRRALLDEGAYVLGTDTQDSPTASKLDISNISELEDYVEIQSIMGSKIDGVINNAAVSFKGLNIAEEQFKKTLDINVMGTHNCMAKLKPLIAANGAIVNVASIYGLLSPNFNIYDGSVELYSSAAYGASKAAIIQMTKYYSVQYAPDIRVNAVSPGGIFQGHDDVFSSKYSERVPFKRMANPEEIVNAILFLLSPLSSYITGQNLVVDGGMSVW